MNVITRRRVLAGFIVSLCAAFLAPIPGAAQEMTPISPPPVRPALVNVTKDPVLRSWLLADGRAVVSSVADAVLLVADHGSVIVHPGDYDEKQIILDRPVSILGWPAQSGGSLPTLYHTDSPLRATFALVSRDTHVNGFTIVRQDNNPWWYMTIAPAEDPLWYRSVDNVRVVRHVPDTDDQVGPAIDGELAWVQQ